MSTKLNTDVIRETEAMFRDGGKERAIVVKLHKCRKAGGACITMSLKSTRGETMTVTVGVKSLYLQHIFEKHGLPK
jgi:hypothetical protein